MNATMCLVRGMISQTVLRPNDPVYYESMLNFWKQQVRQHFPIKPAIVAGQSAQGCHGMTAALTIEGLKLDFYGVQVLRGVDFAVPQGSFTGLIGPNGAGKSTLFNAVSGLYRPERGYCPRWGRPRRRAWRRRSSSRPGLCAPFSSRAAFPSSASSSI